MFSLPSIPAAPSAKKYAPTTTQSFPTRQTVTTPFESRAVGDWGFKRSFPLKTTTKSTQPYIRINHIDTIEGVTDFASATDHTLSLRKWHEMGVPITIPQADAHFQEPPKSVFEETFDMTHSVAAQHKPSDPDQIRWKFQGPWLANLTEGQFQKYLKRAVRPRREEFRQFLRERIAADMNTEERAGALGNGPGTNEVKQIQPDDITEQQLTSYLRSLRENNRVELYQLVGQFLDLAPLAPPQNFQFIDSLSFTPQTIGKQNPYAAEGPPITHPSAGMSYIRTNSYLDNHPIYGPQNTHPPVRARVLNPASSDLKSWPSIGVGGFVAQVPRNDNIFNTIRTASSNPEQAKFLKALRTIDPTVYGGAKIWVQPSKAHVLSDGRIQLEIGPSAEESELIEDELQGRSRVLNAPSTPQKDSFPRKSGLVHRTRTRPPPIGNSRAFGLKPDSSLNTGESPHGPIGL